MGPSAEHDEGPSETQEEPHHTEEASDRLETGRTEHHRTLHLGSLEVLDYQAVATPAGNKQRQPYLLVRCNVIVDV